MNHPILRAALARDRLHQCSCGAMTPEPYSMFRGCQAAAVSRHETARSSRRAAPRWTQAGIGKTRLFARAASLVRIIGKGPES
jgi:hypothetical protein